MNVRLTQIDGALPNLALMKLAHWHRARGDHVVLTRDLQRGLFEPVYERVYGSAIFSFSQLRLMRFQREWPEAIIGGTGTPSTRAVEELTGDYEHYDYTDYPDCDYSLGFTQRGCRLSCKFCVVPAKEGRPQSVNTIHNIWRGDHHPRKVHLLDNDFFGQPAEQWRARINELREGGFRVCFGQGINLRLLTDEQAEALASVEYRDTDFRRRRLYTAWDNLKDERIFFAGVDRLERAGVPPSHLRTYMLVGFAKEETFERVMYRFDRMVERGIEPYPMVYDRSRKDLCHFQRWVVTGLYRAVPWQEYRPALEAA